MSGPVYPHDCAACVYLGTETIVLDPPADSRSCEWCSWATELYMTLDTDNARV